ncbi:MAG TPA: hypothetical protein VIH47_07390 [Solirubrobacterales bacterium]
MDLREQQGDHRPRSGAGAAGLRSRLLALALAGAALALALPQGASAAPPAHAARFTYELCDSALPGGAVPASSYSYSSDFTPFENCPSPGGSIGLVETSPASGTFGALSILVPETPGGFVESETITAVQAGIDPAGGLGPSHVYENGFPGASAESTRLFQQHTERAYFFGNGGGFNVVMSCSLPATCSPGPAIGARWIAATEVDPNPPKLLGLQGSLLSGGTIRGHQGLAVEGSDEGGGLSNISVFVNGSPGAAPIVGSCSLASVANKSYVGTVALSTTPCPPKLKAEWQLNTEKSPFHDGANSVQVCASDFSTLGDPNTTCLPAKTVNTDNSCANSTVTGGELLSAQFTKSNSETLTVGSGKEAEVVGTLRTNSGDPVAGATLCVKMQTLEVDAQASPVGTVTTDGNGNYSYKVPAGPNRDVVIGYRHDTSQVARDVRYYAHARPSLKSSSDHLHNGEQVKFWGQLQGPHRFGRVVILQANVKGSKRWITFRKATSIEKGIFRAKYHFTSTTRTTTYRFRAVVPDQVGYPWVQGHSRPLSVRVSR